MITEDQLEQLAIQWYETLTPALSHGEKEALRTLTLPRPRGMEVLRTLIPTFSQREKEKERVVIPRLDPAIPEDASATHKNSLSVQIKSKGG